MKLLRMAKYEDIKRSREKFEFQKRRHVKVWYGFPTIDDSVEHVINLFKEIQKDLPNITPNEVKVTPLGKWQSEMHGGYTCLLVNFPIEKYLELRDAHLFEIL